MISVPKLYTQSEERLRRRLEKSQDEAEEATEKFAFRKRRELLRRRVHAALYEPRQCMGDPVTGAACDLVAVAGATLCPRHGGTTKSMQNAAHMRLLYLVEPALRVIGKCMTSLDENIRLKAAQILLDRAGFHPHATLEIKEQPMDLSSLSNAQLKARAERLIEAMEYSADQAVTEALDTETVDAEKVSSRVEESEDDPDDPVSVH